MVKKTMIALTVLCMVSFMFAGNIVVGEKPAELALDGGKLGGRVDKTAWSSSELQGKVWCLFYVDPDESDINVAAEDALTAMGYTNEQVMSTAVINMSAAKLPKFAISMVLKNKQKQYPGTVYVKDNKKVFVDKWGLTDDTYCVLVFDKNGVLVYRKDGQLSPEDIQEYLAVVASAL